MAKIHAKIKDTRTDFLNKLSPRVVRENQTIILGDLVLRYLVWFDRGA
ncbi:transposase [Microcystis aeruginosa]